MQRNEARIGAMEPRLAAREAAAVDVAARESAPRLIDAKRAQHTLCICARRLWELRSINAIPFHRIGKSIRFSPDELDAWIKAGCPTHHNAADQVRKAIGR